MAYPPTPLLEVNNLSLRFGERTILSQVSFKMQAQEILTLVGPNGAGKSSLVRAVLGLLPPYEGQIITKPGLRMAYMPQQLYLEPSIPISVKRFLSLSPLASEAGIQAVSARLKLENLLSLSMHTLSGGERQRVLLGRAILNQAELLILDEPAQGADIPGQAKLYGLIKSIRDELGCGIMMISHDLHMVMAGTDQVICLNGHICCSGTPSQVTQDPHFLSLFGLRTAPTGLAVYTHQHGHRHD